MARVRGRDAEQRDHIETAQAMLCGMLVNLDECILRNQQAMRRTSLVGEVLEPAVVRMEMLRAELRVVQRELTAAWLMGQAVKWRNDGTKTGKGEGGGEGGRG